VWPPQAAESKGWQNGQQNIVNEKRMFFALRKFYVVEPIERNFIK
jgi:hypothetical protein